MSESTPPGRPKPGSLRDRIAAFEQKPAPAASPPPPRAKPGNLSKWTPKPAEPPSSSQEQPARHEGGMNANDAKASIGAGGSLKERMAALQGLGAFGGPASAERPRPPVSEKPKWKPPPQVPLSPPIGEDGSEAQPTLPTLPVGIPDDQAVTSPLANQESGEQPEPLEGEEGAVGPEEEERQRRAAIAARMARLGGARVGIGPPVFGKKPTPPPKKLSTDVKDETISPIHPTEGTAPKASTSISGTETAAQPANESPSSVDEADAAAQAGSSVSPPSTSSSMPVPAAPRRVAPPRRKTPKAPESTPAPTSVDSVNSGATEAEQAPAAALPPVPAEPVVLAKDAVLPTSPEPLESPQGVRGSSPSQQSDTKLDEHNTGTVSPITYIEQINLRPEMSPVDDDSPSSPHLLASEPSIMHGSLGGAERSASPRGEQFKEDDEEDEETRRKRIAERVASIGGFNPLSSPPAVREADGVSGIKLVTPSEDDLSPARPADQDDTENTIGSTTESQEEYQVVPPEHEGESAEVAHEAGDTEGEQIRNPTSSPTTTDLPVPSPPPMIRKGSSSSIKSYSVTQIGRSQPTGEEREDDDGLDTGVIDFQRDVDEDHDRGYVPLSSAPQSARQHLPTSASSSTYSPLPEPDVAQLERSISSLDEEDDSQALVQQEYGLNEEDQVEQDVVSPPPPRRPTLPPPKRLLLPPTRAVPPPVAVELPQTQYSTSTEDESEGSSEKEDIPASAISTSRMPDERHTIGELASPTSEPHSATRPLSANRTSFPPAPALPPVVPITADSEVRPPSHVRKPSAPRDWTPIPPDLASSSHGRRTSSDAGNIILPPPILSTRSPVRSSRRSVDEKRASLDQSQVVNIPSASPAISPSSGLRPLSPSNTLSAVPVPSRAAINQIQPPSLEGAKQAESEALSDSDGDPIDPRFHSPLPKSPPRPVASKSPPSISAVPGAPNEEDPEQAQRRTIAERMARLGGIRFGAPPPSNIRSTPARQASMSAPENVQDSDKARLDHDLPDNQQDAPEVLEEPEEDDQARRARIAARLAASGGMRFGMIPGHAPPAPSTSPPISAMQGDVESEDEPKSRPARAPAMAPMPPSHPAPAPPPSLRGALATHSQLVLPSQNAVPLSLAQSTPTSAYDMYEEQQEDDTEQVKHEEPEEYEEEMTPPSLPPPRPSTRPPIPQTPRKSSVGVASGSQPRRSSSAETASQTHSRRVSSQTAEIPSQPNISLHHPSEYVMVEQDGDTRAAPSSSQSMRRLPPARAPPTQPPMPPVESSQWELPSIPSGGLDFGDASAQSDLSGSFLSEDSTTYPRTDASGPPNQSGTVPKPIPVDMSSDDLSVAWGRVGVHMVEAANALLERSKRSLIGNGSYAGFINAVFAQVPQARAPQAGTDYGYLVYAQVGSTVQTRASDIMPGDIIVLQDARLKGHKGLHNYSLSVGEGSPCIGIVSDFEAKKAKIRTLQANQHVGQATVETASYRLEDLKSGSIKVYRVLES